MKVLIIEDEYSLADAISEMLKKENFQVKIMTNGEDGENEALTNIYDLILLDVMLPKKSGFEILKNLREEKIDTPVIMLTAKSEIPDKLNGLENGATVITKSKEIFQSSRNFTGDFEIDGYSSYDAMTNFVDGTYKITDGEMISDFDGYECVISSELAKLNDVTVGSKITLKNPTNDEKTYEFTVTGIYTDNSNADDTKNMYLPSANKIITGSGVVDLLACDDDTLVTDVTPSFILKDKDVLDLFIEEVRKKGLNEYYTISTNLEELEGATKSIENVKTFATTFLIITLIISGIVLFIINMINIRERKYEIGVFRTIGVSKLKLTIQFILELLIVSIIMLIIGVSCGSVHLLY